MNLKKMWKRFWNLNVHNHEGFTLVELIIVIAILAILSSVAVVGYSSYIKKANMQADKTLAAEVANALMLAYYADPNGGDRVVSIVLTTDGAVASQDDAFAISAMVDAYGANWADALKLKYTKWGNGVAVSQDVLAYFVGIDEDSPLYDIFQGNADISYTDNMHELFDLMEETAVLIAGKRANTLGSGANMVTNAAGITNGMTAPNGYNSAAEYFAEKWASSAWDSSIMMGDTSYGGDAGQLTDDQLTDAIANAAVIKARNVALATYLAGKGFSDAYDAIANYNFPNSSVPDDAAGCIFAGEADKLGLTLTEDLENAIIEYFNIGGDATTSQAYTDGLAYFAMMSTVDSLSDSTNLDKNNDETWWNDLSSAVDIYAAIANGTMTLEDLNNMYSGVDATENSVVVMLMVVNGNPTVLISPAGANS